MKRARVLVPALALALALTLALAVDYRTDPTGGPDTLSAQVAAAFAAWQALEPSLEGTPSEDAATLLRYGDASAFGPDTLSLTVQRQGEPRRLEVLLNPAGDDLDAALLHEAGVLLGVALSEVGVMNPAIGEGERRLGEAELAELAAVQTFVRGDLDRSGQVDFYDLLELARAFGQTGVNLSADLNEDGVVNQADLQLLREVYTFRPPAREPPGRANEGEPDGDENFPDLGELEDGEGEISEDEAADGEADDVEVSEGEAADDEGASEDDAGDGDGDGDDDAGSGD